MLGIARKRLLACGHGAIQGSLIAAHAVEKVLAHDILEVRRSFDGRLRCGCDGGTSVLRMLAGNEHGEQHQPLHLVSWVQGHAAANPWRASRTIDVPPAVYEIGSTASVMGEGSE
ncbi:MAG: hypothetical protein AB7P03_16845 [Kofleriaceae bacterium]